jgi:hypothetical protein
LHQETAGRAVIVEVDDDLLGTLVDRGARGRAKADGHHEGKA